jgi:hypothetical protein
VCNTAKTRDLFFQRSAFPPQDKLLRSEHPLDRIANFAANDRELRGQIKLRDGTVGCREWISAHAEKDPVWYDATAIRQ